MPFCAGGSGPSSGSLALNANGSLTYMPNTGFSGTDRFSYYAEDPLGEKDIAMVTINVEPPINSAPVAKNDSYTTEEDAELFVAFHEGVLSNDSDPDGEPMEAVLVSEPLNGRLELSNDGSFSYMPFRDTAVATALPINPPTVPTAAIRPPLPSRSRPPIIRRRVSEGLLALYDFKEGAGTTVRDVSGVGTPLDLTIIKPSAVNWMADGGLSIQASTAIRSPGAGNQNHQCVESQPGGDHRSLGHTCQYHPVRTGADRGPLG